MKELLIRFQQEPGFLNMGEFKKLEKYFKEFYELLSLYENSFHYSPSLNAVFVDIEKTNWYINRLKSNSSED